MMGEYKGHFFKCYQKYTYMRKKVVPDAIYEELEREGSARIKRLTGMF